MKNSSRTQNVSVFWIDSLTEHGVSRQAKRLFLDSTGKTCFMVQAKILKHYETTLDSKRFKGFSAR